jgi:hypothetical protein
MLGGEAVLLDETLNFLEARDDPFFSRGTASGFPEFGLDAQLAEERVVLVNLDTCRLRLGALEERHALGHTFLPGIRRVRASNKTRVWALRGYEQAFCLRRPLGGRGSDLAARTPQAQGRPTSMR